MLYPPVVYSTLGDQGGSGYNRITLPLEFADLFGYIQLRRPYPVDVFFPQPMLAALKPDAIVFHRLHTDEQIKYIKKCREIVDSTILYNVDDWVEKVPKYSVHYKDVPKTIGKDIRRALKFCDVLIASTDTVANAYGHGIKTVIMPNYLPYTIWSSFYTNTTIKRFAYSHSKPRIGWAGAMGHAADTDILIDIAQELGDSVQWVLIDTGELPRGFSPLNCEIHAAVKPQDFPELLWKMNLDIALCPLVDNDFNRARTNLRVLENGACGYPVIASDVHAFKHCPVDKVKWDPKEWAKIIKDKLTNLDRTKEEGDKLRQWVWDTHKLEDHLIDYSKLLSPDGSGFQPKNLTIDDVEPTVDIIITTANNKEVSERCINSVLESLPENQTPVEIVISDDASTNPEMLSYLNSIVDKVTLNILPSSQGYIGNVNSAIQIHPDRDIITLNSDTIVHGNWVDRLRDVAYENGHGNMIASVTPMSNNATICSYPDPMGSELHPKLVEFYDDIAKGIYYPAVQLISSVGFCTYMRRSALSTIGLFDQHAFGRGYGEENDWSMRANLRNYRNVVAPNVYVGHEGTATFKQNKTNLMKNASNVLQVRHQKYFGLVEEWMKRGYLNGLRQLYDFAAIEKNSYSDRTLYIAHAYGGGIDTYLESKLGQASNAVILRNELNTTNLKLEFINDTYNNLPIINTTNISLTYLAKLFKKFRITNIEVHTTAMYSYNFPYWIMALAKKMDITYDVFLHDYWFICPRIKFTSKEYYCGEPEPEECNECIATRGSYMGQTDIYDWRDLHYKFLKKANRLMAPSMDTVVRFNKYYPDLVIECEPHEDDLIIEEYGVAKYESGTIRVAVIGSIIPEKGSLLIRQCAEYCIQNNIDLQFVVFGTLQDSTQGFIQMIPENPKIKILGVYKEEKLRELLMYNRCHVGFFSSLWPETYSYTLSHMMRAGLKPIAFDLGAPADRIKAMQFGKLIPFDKHTDIPFIVETLIATAKE